MAIHVPRGKKDKQVNEIIAALKKYQKAHDKAQIDVYRQSPVSVRIRIVDPDFHALDKPSRHERTWRFLEKLPEEVQGDISMLVLLTPQETHLSMANLEFDDPIPATM